MKKPVVGDGFGLKINGRRKFMLSAEMQYFRIPVGLWADRLRKARAGFMNMISVYHAWNFHESPRGTFDFKTENKNLDSWLTHIEREGMDIFARVGPFMSAEWDCGGVANWVYAGEELFETRTDHPRWLAQVKDWYAALNKVLSPHQIQHGGGIVLYQVENEHCWGNRAYHARLAAFARANGIKVPVVVNANPTQWGTDLLDTFGDYTDPWAVGAVENNIRKLQRGQPGQPVLCTEFSGGWFARIEDPLPTGRGDFPAAWTDMQIKTLLAEGLHGFNVYMFHGCTSFPYWACKGVPTSYDFQAPVREWGELSERWYVFRRISAMLDSIGPALMETKKLRDETVDGVNIKVRKGRAGEFVCLRNVTPRDRTAKVDGVSYSVPGLTMGIFPRRLKLAPGFVLRHSSSELFRVFGPDAAREAVFYCEPGQTHNLFVAAAGKLQIEAAGLVKTRKIRNGVALTFKQGVKTGFARIVAGKKSLGLILTTPAKAGRTWFAKKDDREMALVSNIYFVRNTRAVGDAIILDAELRAAPEIEIAPWAGVKKIVAPALPSAPDFKVELPLADFAWRKEELAGGARRDIPSNRPLEAFGLLENGYYRYRITVDLPAGDWTLDLAGYQHEASVFINGRLAGHAINRMRQPIAKLLQPGRNTVDVRIECTGHPNGGFPIGNGLIAPVYLDDGSEVTVDLPTWRRRMDPANSSEDALKACKPPEVQPGFDDSGWDEVPVTEGWDSRFYMPGWQRQIYWYRTKVNAPAGNYFSLDLGEAHDEVAVFVNGKYVRWFPYRLYTQQHNRSVQESFESASSLYDQNAVKLDVSGFIHPGGENTIVLGLIKRYPNSHGGLHKHARLSTHARRVDTWQVAPGLNGQADGWAQNAPGFAAGFRPDAVAPGDAVWLVKNVTLDLPAGWTMPLALDVGDLRGKALIYLNGRAIGRYEDNGCQKTFYLHEPFVQKENTLALLVDTRGQPFHGTRMSIRPFYTARQMEIRLEC